MNLPLWMRNVVNFVHLSASFDTTGNIICSLVSFYVESERARSIYIIQPVADDSLFSPVSLDIEKYSGCVE